MIKKDRDTPEAKKDSLEIIHSHPGSDLDLPPLQKIIQDADKSQANLSHANYKSLFCKEAEKKSKVAQFKQAELVRTNSLYAVENMYGEMNRVQSTNSGPNPKVRNYKSKTRTFI